MKRSLRIKLPTAVSLLLAAVAASDAAESTVAVKTMATVQPAEVASPVWKEEHAQDGERGLRYLVWVPATARPPKDGWPLLVWLHGFSLRGDDLTKVKSYGPPAVMDRLEPRFILVAPQLPSKQLVWDVGPLQSLLAHVQRRHAVADARVYLAGASLGAAGAYEWAAASPDRFAGLVLLAGAGNPGKAGRLSGIPIWVFHGDEDRQVPLRKARTMERAIQEAGGSIRFTELAGVGHDAEQLTRVAFVERKAVVWLLTLSRTPGGDNGPVPPRGALGTSEAPRDKHVEETSRQAALLKNSLPELHATIPVPSTETIFRWIEELCSTPHRRPGTAEGRRGEEWIAQQFRAVGLENVSCDRVPIRVWQPQSWSLRVDGKNVECFFLLNSGFTGASGITAPLTWGGAGQIGEIRGSEAKGKIVVARARATYHDDAAASPRSYFQSAPDGQSRTVTHHAAFPSNLLGGFLPIKITDAYERAKNLGAAGFLMTTADLRSQGSSFYWPYDGEMKTLPALYVAHGDSAFVESAAKAGRSATLVQTGSVTDGSMGNVWGILPGRSDDLLFITSHHDSPHQGAVEDGSGIAQVLAQAWAWSRLPREQRPLTLVFIAAAGHFYKGQGAYEFAKAHPELLARCRAVVTLEHLPAKEVRRALDGSYQFTGRTQPVTIYMPQNPVLVASVWKALDAHNPPFAVSAERPLLSGPLSDAAGYFQRSKERGSGFTRAGGVPYVSWISAPLYLVDSADTPDKIEKDQLLPLARTIATVIGQLMASPPAGN